MDNIIDLDDITNLTDVQIMNLFDDINFDVTENIKCSNNLDCPKCKTANFIINDISGGMSICSKCGQVVDMLTDMGPENRQFDDDKNETRQMGIPINKLLPQSSLGTTISGHYKSRLKILHSWSAMPYKERSLNLVFKDIQHRCQQFNIMKCIEEDAKIMYKTISECKHFKGKNNGKFIIIRGANRKSLIGACVFFACRRKGMTRSPKEIADIFEIKYTEMTRGCKNFMKLMKLKKMSLNVGTSKPEDFIARFCKELKIKEPYLQQTLKIAKNIRKLNIASVHTPLSSATGSILLMAELSGLTYITKRKLAEQFRVSEVTITKTYKKLDQFKKALVDDELTDRIVDMIKEQEKKDQVPDFITEKCKYFNGLNQSNDKVEPDIDTIEEIYEDTIEELENEFNQYDDLYDNDEMLSFGQEIDIMNEQLLRCSIEHNVYELLNQIDDEVSEELLRTDIEYQKALLN